MWKFYLILRNTSKTDIHFKQLKYLGTIADKCDFGAQLGLTFAVNYNENYLVKPYVS